MTRENSNDTVVIHAVGDVGPRRVDYGEEPESLFAKVHHKLKEADISFCQLEWNFSEKGCYQWRWHTTWYGRAKPENVKAMVFAGFNVVSHAGNHCFNFGPEPLLETIDLLHANNMQVVGVGKDITEARKPAIIEKKGTRVGFLAYNSILPAEVEARADKPGCAPVRASTYYESQDFAPGMPPKILTIPLEEDVRALEEDIRKLKSQVDIVFVSMHWGTHFIPGNLAMYQPVVGHRAIEAGADIIVGHHPHLIKGIEIYKGRPIFYSVGNFAMETPRHLNPPPGARGERVSSKYRKYQDEPGWERYNGPLDKRYAIMVKMLVKGKTLEKVSFLPIWINQLAEPEFLSHGDPRFDEAVRYTEQWCSELGTKLTVEGDEVTVLNSTARA